MNARYCGSAHDSYVWGSSKVLAMFENEYTGPENQKFWLLGDAGYPLQPWLHNPIRNPTTDKEEKYNKLHCSTRNAVERSIGEWKNRFR